jgi:hypothetical protein
MENKKHKSVSELRVSLSEGSAASKLINGLYEAGTFAQLGAFVKRNTVAADNGDKASDFEGVITGYGAVDGRLVFAYVQDSSRMKGAFGDAQAKKICAIYDMAMKAGAPVIGVFDSCGAKIEEGVMAMAAYAKVMNKASEASGYIPQIAVINGVCAGSAAAIAAIAIYRTIEGLVIAFFGGFSSAASVIVGKDVGAGHHMRGYRNAVASSILCPAVTFCICLVLFLVNQPTLRLFGLESEALFYGKYMLLIYLVAGSIRTCNYITNNCFRVGGESLFGAIMDLVCLFCLSVPATWIAGMVFDLPFLAVFAFVYMDEPIKLFFMSRYARSGKWVKPVTEAGRAALPAFQAELKLLRTRVRS